MKKRRTEKKVLSAVLAAAMVMSMTACGQGFPEPENSGYCG